MLLALILSLQTAPEIITTNNRVPSAALVQELEDKLHLPSGALPFSKYTRFYTEIDLSGRDTVIGQLVESDLIKNYCIRSGKPVPPPLSRGLEDVLQPVADGGCATAVMVLYDVQARMPPEVVCNASGPGGR